MRGRNNYNNIFMVCSCDKYKYRQPLLENMYQQNIKNGDTYIFLKGNINIIHPILENNTLVLNCGDLYENLPEKVVLGIQYITRNFSFNKLIKVDDDVVINFKLYYNLLYSLPNKGLYYGKCNTQYANSLNTSWHINKLSKAHPLNNKPCPVSFFPINDKEFIQYPCGPCYILSNDVCNIILNFNENDIAHTKNHIYEDVNLYMLLLKYNITSSLAKTNAYLLIELPPIVKNNIKKFPSINNAVPIKSHGKLLYTNTLLKHKKRYPIITFLYNNNFFNKYKYMLTFHIGSITNMYTIDEVTFKISFMVFNTFNGGK
jgi:hypothetical protein